MRTVQRTVSGLTRSQPSAGLVNRPHPHEGKPLFLLDFGERADDRDGADGFGPTFWGAPCTGLSEAQVESSSGEN